MANFKDLFINFALIGLIVLSILEFGVTFQEDNNIEDKFIENSLMNNTYSKLNYYKRSPPDPKASDILDFIHRFEQLEKGDITKLKIEHISPKIIEQLAKLHVRTDSVGWMWNCAARVTWSGAAPETCFFDVPPAVGAAKVSHPVTARLIEEAT